MWSRHTGMLGVRSRKGTHGAEQPPSEMLDAGDAWRSPTDRGTPARETRLNEDPWEGYCLEAIARLPAVYRSAMILSNLEGFSTDEIARLAGVGPPAIDSLLVRGREIVREELLDCLRKLT